MIRCCWLRGLTSTCKILFDDALIKSIIVHPIKAKFTISIRYLIYCVQFSTPDEANFKKFNVEMKQKLDKPVMRIFCLITQKKKTKHKLLNEAEKSEQNSYFNQIQMMRVKRLKKLGNNAIARASGKWLYKKNIWNKLVVNHDGVRETNTVYSNSVYI